MLGELSARRFDPCSLFPAPGLRGLERFLPQWLHFCTFRRPSSLLPPQGKLLLRQSLEIYLVIEVAFARKNFEENFELSTYDLLSTNFLPSTQCAALRVTIVFQPWRDSAPQMRPSEAAYAPVTTLTSRGRLGGSKRKKPCFSCHLFTNWWVLLGLSLTAFAVQTSKGALAWGLGEIFDCHQVGFDFRLDRKRVPSLIVLQLLRRCGV